MRHLVPRGRGITELHCFVHRGHVRSYGDASPRSAPLSWTRRPGQYHRDYGLPPSIHGCLTLVTDWNMRTSPDTLQWASRLRHTQGFSFEAGLSGQGTLSPPPPSPCRARVAETSIPSEPHREPLAQTSSGPEPARTESSVDRAGPLWDLSSATGSLSYTCGTSARDISQPLCGRPRHQSPTMGARATPSPRGIACLIRLRSTPPPPGQP